MDAADLGPCEICGRPMCEGPSVDRHHWVPRVHGGGAASPLHLICHRMIHRVFSDRDLALRYRDAESLRAHPDMARFIVWVRRKPSEYVDWPKSPRRRPTGRPRRAGQ